jgi:uncharacterized protein
MMEGFDVKWTRSIVVFRSLTALLVAAALIASARAEDLYQGHTIATGQVEETRIPGVRECFVQVLARVSGDARLIGDERVTALAENAGALITGLRYRDRMAGIPVHDEQGTYDRPYDLIVSFDPAGIDAALRSLGREPWAGARPRLTLFVAVSSPAGPFVLAADAERGADMRQALANAAELAGLPAALPKRAALSAAGLGPEALASADLAALQAAASKDGRALAGALTWSDAEMGWIANWRMKFGGAEFRWGVRGVSFDAAFRNALSGAAQILSGNGAPG